MLLQEGGSVGNFGLITSYETGVSAHYASGTVTNSGTIESTGSSGFNSAIFLVSGGTVTNGSPTDPTALISASDGEAVEIGVKGTVTGRGTLTNFGTIITPTIHTAVYLAAGGTVTNGASGSSTALISGHDQGALAENLAATVVNYGTIGGITHVGINLGAGGQVTNFDLIHNTSTAYAAVYLGAGGDQRYSRSDYSAHYRRWRRGFSP